MPDHVTVDAPQLARNKSTLSGEFSVAQLPRLAEYLYDNTGALRYAISATLDRRQRPQIHCIINGYLQLVCQRCLRALAFEVATDSTLVLVGDESLLPPPEEEDDDTDFIVSTPTLDVTKLVEDEIILGLPMVPRHEDPACDVAANLRATSEAI